MAKGMFHEIDFKRAGLLDDIWLYLEKISYSENEKQY
jgi:hypothetical protein